MLVAPATSLLADEPFEPLFNGENLNGWFTFDNTYGVGNDVEEYYKVEDGELVILDIPESSDNKAFGYLSTVNDYANYHLRFEYQWGEKKFAPRANQIRDSGVLYHLVGTDRIWPNSLESQMQEGDTGDFFGLGGARITSTDNGGAYSTTGTVRSKRANIRASTVADTLDGWNVSEVVVRGDSAVHIVNGQVVNRIWDARLNGESLKAGRIALQAEGATIRYRNIEIRELASSTPRILLFSETRGFRHNSIPNALDSLEELATSAGMDVDRASDSADVFTDSNLAGFDAVVWVMTTGDVLDDDEQAAFEHYIRSGGGCGSDRCASRSAAT
ncbi:MAG: family 16 glycoside hydrolase [Granulosicoccus sp.]